MPRFTQGTNRIWTERTFGVEMEMTRQNRNGNAIDGTQIRRAMSDSCRTSVNGDGTYYRSQHAGRTWEVKYDMSAGFEVVTPALTLDGEGHCDELQRGCDVLANEIRPKLTRACGVHVHVAANDYDWKDLQKLVALWMRYEPFFFEMVPSSRRSNSYCSPLRGSDWEAAERHDQNTNGYGQVAKQSLDANTERAFDSTARNLPRTSSLNISQWWYHGRVEFRLHGASVDYEKIRAWVVLLTTLVSRVKVENAPKLSRKVNQKRPTAGFSTAYVLRMIGLGPSRWQAETQVYREVHDWVEGRRRKFSPTTHRRRAPRLDTSDAAAIRAAASAEREAERLAAAAERAERARVAAEAQAAADAAANAAQEEARRALRDRIEALRTQDARARSTGRMV